jgi:hypothetical protein
MLKKPLSIVLILLLVQLASVSPSYGKTNDEGRQTQRAEKVKDAVAKLGIGEMARVKIKLEDGTKLEGYIGEANNENLVVMNARSGQAVRVAYPQIKQVKGHNISTGTRIAIGVAFVVAILIIVVLVGRS